MTQTVPPPPPRPGPKQGDLGAAALPRQTLQWLGMKRMKRTAENGGGDSLGWPLVVGVDWPAAGKAGIPRHPRHRRELRTALFISRV